MSVNVEQLSCQELVELVTAYLEDALSGNDRARFEEHLAACVNCQVYLEQMRTTIELVGRLSPAELSPQAEQALLDAFGSWKSG
jgi:anti-sigma factor RsiW